MHANNNESYEKCIADALFFCWDRQTIRSIIAVEFHVAQKNKWRAINFKLNSNQFIF